MPDQSDARTTATLRRGQRFHVKDSMAITPHIVEVEVRWVDAENDVVHYHKHGWPAHQTAHTSIRRFTEIVQARKPQA